MLYDQLSSPLMFKTFGISLEESKLKIMKREKDVEQKAVNLYLGVLLGAERLKNKNEEYGLYGRLLELMRAEYRVGMKTMLDVIDTETDLLETELGLEELSAQQLILEKDLINMIGLESSNYRIELNSSAAYILSSLFNLNDAVSFEDLYKYLLSMEDQIEDIDALYTIALRNDFGVKKMKLSLMQNRVKQKLLSIQFLENISLSYGIDFAGERFFPANTSHTFAVNFLLDFGIVSSDIKVTESSSEGFKAGSQEARYCIAVSNGTVAIETALIALDVGMGDEVIVPDYTFVASASAVVATNAIPIFCDINFDTFIMDVDKVQSLITPRTRAIVAVHLGGNPVEMDRLCEIAREHHIKIVKDCAHSHGSRYKGKRVGKWGDVGTFSFQASKVLTSGEGIDYSGDNCGGEKSDNRYFPVVTDIYSRSVQLSQYLLLAEKEMLDYVVNVIQSLS